MTYLSGLEGLESIGGWLDIYNNNALETLSSLSSLTSVGQAINISENDSLPGCWAWLLSSQTGLPCGFCDNNRGTGSCGTLPDGFQCEPGAVGPGVLDTFFVDIGVSHDINELSGVTCVTGDLNVYDTTLSDLGGLETLQMVGGTLFIIDNPNLTSLSGLDNLESVGGTLEIHYNGALTTLSSLSSLNSIGWGLSVSYNQNLAQCEADALALQVNVPCTGCIGNNGSGSCP